MKALLIAALVATLATFAVACGDDDNGGTGPDGGQTPVTRTPDAGEPEPTEPPSNVVPRSVQAAIDAALAGDVEALIGMVRFSRIECVEEAQGAGAPPICEEGEEEGTFVEVLPAAQCEGFYVREGDVAEEMERLVSELELYAVYETPQSYFPPGPYSAVFNGTNEGGDTVGREIIADANGVVGLNLGCAGDAATLAQTRGLTEAIVEPE